MHECILLDDGTNRPKRKLKHFVRITNIVKKAIESHCGVDAPGSFIAWLCAQTAVHAYKMPGRRFDIGNLESYRLVQKEYNGINK